VIELFTGGLARLYRPIDNLRAFRHLNLGRVPFQRISAGGRDGSRHHQQSRPGNVSSLNCLLNADVAVTRTFGFHIPQRGEALLECPPRRDCSSRRAHGQWRSQNVGVISALCGIFSLQKDVSVRVDQAGKDRLFR
jgi:hypothetical protein